MAKTPGRTTRSRARPAGKAVAARRARKTAAEISGADMMADPPDQADVPLKDRPGAERQTVFADVDRYSVTLPAGALNGASVLEHAQAHPYLGLSVSGAGDLGAAGEERLERIYYVFGDAVAGEVQTRIRNGRYEVFAGVASAHFAAAHHIVQSERPLKVRLSVWSHDGEIEFETADLYAPGQQVGQRED